MNDKDAIYFGLLMSKYHKQINCGYYNNNKLSDEKRGKLRKKRKKKKRK